MAAANLIHSFKSVLSRLSLPQTTSVAVAVSGGSDSLALTYLARQVFDRVVGITVDHRIRPESEVESLKAKESVLALGAEHKLVSLNWSDGIPSKGKMQTVCRHRRYEALANVCHNENIKLLLVGHHWDDQIETVVHRIARSSGINGLSGILPVTNYGKPSVTVCRPLLEIRKDSLKQLCIEENLQWVEDPTNSHPVFWRNVIRQLLTEQPQLSEGLDEIRLTCAVAKQKANSEVSQALQGVHIDQTYGYAIIKRSLFHTLSRPVALRLLHTLTQFITGNYRSFQSLKLNVVYEQILRENFKCCSHGSCNIFAIDENLVGVAREMDQRGTLSQPITIGQTLHWKNRFLLKLSPLSDSTPPSNTTFHVRSMKHDDSALLHRGVRKVKATILPPIHARGGLPVIVDKENDHVVLIPHFKVNDTSYGVKCSFEFKLPRGLKECIHGPDESAVE